MITREIIGDFEVMFDGLIPIDFVELDREEARKKFEILAGKIRTLASRRQRCVQYLIELKPLVRRDAKRKVPKEQSEHYYNFEETKIELTQLEDQISKLSAELERNAFIARIEGWCK